MSPTINMTMQQYAVEIAAAEARGRAEQHRLDTEAVGDVLPVEALDDVSLSDAWRIFARLRHALAAADPAPVSGETLADPTFPAHCCGEQIASYAFHVCLEQQASATPGDDDSEFPDRLRYAGPLHPSLKRPADD